jgi:hypothetical protein
VSRPTILTPAVQPAIVSRLRAGAYIADAAEAAGVAERTVYQWLQKGAEALDSADASGPSDGSRPEGSCIYALFAQAVTKARAEARVEAVAAIRRAMIGDSAKYDDSGRLVRSEIRPDWRAALAYLERTDPKGWGRVHRTFAELEAQVTAGERFGTLEDEKARALRALDELAALRGNNCTHDEAALPSQRA